MEALLTLAIPAIIKAIELANNKDWKSLTKIGVAVALGLVAGIVGVVGIPTWYEGILWGLSASGLVTVAGYAGIKAGDALKKKDPKTV